MTDDTRGRSPRAPGRAGAAALLVALLSIACSSAGPPASPPPTSAPPPAPPIPDRIATDRVFEVLVVGDAPDPARARLAAAARALGEGRVYLAGETIDAARLARLAATPEREPLLRAVREDLRRAVVLDGLLLLLDDVILAAREGRGPASVWVTPARGRRAGVLVHPDAVYEGRPRLYGAEPGGLDVSRPREQRSYPPARDGEPLGPRWTTRYPNPGTEREMLAALRAAHPSSDFADRLERLMDQLRAAGADVQLNSTVRRRERGYLMWGAYVLAHARDEAELDRLVDLLERRRREWGLDVDVRWRHPLGPRATRAAAREMAEAYDVVYATEAGARESSHYGGRAVDFTAVGLPRTLELVAPDGTRARFDLSDPDETRDLSLTPRLVEWVEEGFGMGKLRADYPHWDDSVE